MKISGIWLRILCFGQSQQESHRTVSHKKFYTPFVIGLLACLFLLTASSPSRAALIIPSDFTQNGGTLTVSPPGELIVTHPTNNPLLTMTSGANSSGVEGARIGDAANEEGQLLINGGSSLSSGGSGSTTSILGFEVGSTGAATVSGSGSSWNISSVFGPAFFVVGNRGTGELVVEDGGSVSSFIAYVANSAGSTGDVTVTGNNSQWLSEEIYVGGNFSSGGGTGTVTVGSGGLVETSAVMKLWTKGSLNLQAGGTLSPRDLDVTLGTFNFTGGTLKTSTGTITGIINVPNGGEVTGYGNFTNLSASSGGVLNPGTTDSDPSNFFAPGSFDVDTGTWGAGGVYRWDMNALASDGGAAGQNDIGWDLLNYTTLGITALSADPFLIELGTFEGSIYGGSMAPGPLNNFDSAESYSWLIATAANGEFSDLSGLDIDASEFVNNLNGGSFSLVSANGGTELYLQFSPGGAPIPEPSSLLLIVFGGIGLLRHRRKSII